MKLQRPAVEGQPVPPGRCDPRPAGMFAALAVRHYPLLWASGWLWSFTRWMAVFLCSYLVNRLTGSPLRVQLVGAAFFAPMFFGGILGGVVSDRFDRRRTIMKQLALLAPVALLMGVIVVGGHTQVWMVYLFMLAVGMGGVLDMTSRRALVFDMVGAGGITNAMALESIAQTGGTMLGSAVGGAVIAVIGTGQAFFVIAAAYAAACLCIAAMGSVPREHAPAAGGSLRRDIAQGLRYVRGHRAITGILGVTVLVNFFYFAYMPMVPVFADRLDVGAFWAGVLAGAAGLGSLIGAAVIAAQPAGRLRRGWIYLGGSMLAMAGLFLFAAARVYVPALLALLAAGFGQAGFGTMQGSLILTAAGAEMRGRSMGVLSMAIGALPFGMVALGLVAQVTNPPVAVMGSVSLGLLGLALWSLRARELRAIR